MLVCFELTMPNRASWNGQLAELTKRDIIRYIMNTEKSQ